MIQPFVKASCEICGTLMSDDSVILLDGTTLINKIKKDNQRKLKATWNMSHSWDLAHLNGEHIIEKNC